MSEIKNDNVDEGPDERIVDKYNLGAADLEKVSVILKLMFFNFQF